MKGVKGTRCRRPLFISEAGMERVSPSIHSFRSLAVSPGRSMEARDQRKSTCIRMVASLKTFITFGKSRHEMEGMGRTIGGANTRLTRSIGLCRMYPAQTAKSMISRVRINTRLSVA